MSAEKKTRPDTAIPERDKMGAGLDRATTSNYQSTTLPASRQFRIADLLPVGEENAVPLRHLRQLVDLPGREIRKQIQAERMQHTPILANNRTGYFLAENDQERERFVRSMYHRANEIIKIARALENPGTDTLDGQTNVEGW